MLVTDKHVFFWRSKLGNWGKVPGNIKYDGKEFPTSEHLFMYLKAIYFGDNITADKILETDSPRLAKDLGREVEGFEESRWEKVREDAMLTAVRYRAKFDKAFLEELLNPDYSGKDFVEASPYDRIWGIGLSETDPSVDDEKNWKGLNLMGKTLNIVRSEYELRD